MGLGEQSVHTWLEVCVCAWGMSYGMGCIKALWLAAPRPGNPTAVLQALGWKAEPGALLPPSSTHPQHPSSGSLIFSPMWGGASASYREELLRSNPHSATCTITLIVVALILVSDMGTITWRPQDCHEVQSWVWEAASPWPPHGSRRDGGVRRRPP